MFKISLADFNTLLLHVEKISNWQNDFVQVLREELKSKLGIDDMSRLLIHLRKMTWLTYKIKHAYF